MDTARAIDFVAWLVGSLTLAWLVVHAFLRFAWTQSVPTGRRHRQSAARSGMHAVGAVVFTFFAAFMTPVHPRLDPLGRHPILITACTAIVFAPLFAGFVWRTGYVSDTRRIDFGRALGIGLVTMTSLAAWSLFVLSRAPSSA